MRTACVRVPSFAVAVERSVEQGLTGQPLIVIDRGRVLDASAELAGVRGVTARQAKALYPRAVFREADHARYREVFGAMLDALERVVPLVEPAGLGAAYAGIEGLADHYEDEFALAGALVGAAREATALLASAGVADGKFPAWVAACVSAPGDAGVVPPGRARKFLQDKDVSLLPFGPELVQRLDLLALRTLGDVAALPRPALEAQFGRPGGRIWELANGIDCDPLRPRRRRETLRERLSFEAPVVATEALVAAARQLVARLARRLRGRTARHLHAQLLAEGRIVWERLETFREPTGDEARMLLVLRTRLSLLELPGAVDTLALTLSGIGREVAKQAKLFTDSQQNLNQIGEAVRQLRARYGRPVVWRVAEVDPWSRHPEERAVLMPYDA
jgi:nucleotidyltransferase/DNA polymerase involved in DNA repair